MLQAAELSRGFHFGFQRDGVIFNLLNFTNNGQHAVEAKLDVLLDGCALAVVHELREVIVEPLKGVDTPA